MKGEREIITRATITKRLMWEAKHNMIASMLTLVFAFLGFGVIHLMVAGAFSSAVNVLSILNGVVFIVFVIFFSVLPFVRGAVRMSKTRRGEFFIAEDELEDMQDNQFSIWQTLRYDNRVNIRNILIDRRPFHRSSYQHVFTFRSGKKFIANSYEYQNTRLETTAQFSMPGDIFYTVFYKDAPEKIILFYSSKIYNYKDQ